MSKKYRLKLNTGRIIGPFTLHQIGELYIKGHIDGSEESQYFPAGDWEPINNFKELSSLIVDIIGKKITLDDLQSSDGDKTLAKISAVQKRKKVKEQEKIKEDFKKEAGPVDPAFQEFKFSKDAEVNVDYEELEKKYSEEHVEEEVEEEEESGVEKTRIVRLNTPPPSDTDDLDKTRIVNPPPPPKEEEPVEVEEEEVEEVEEEPEEIIDQGEKTEFVNLDNLMPAIKKEARKAEKEIRKKEEELEEVTETKKKKKAKNKEEGNDEEEVKEKKKMKPIIAVVFILLLALLIFDDEDEKKSAPINPRAAKFSMPVPAEVLDPIKGDEFFSKGLETYDKGTYLAKVFAADYFRKSLISKYQDNKALGHLILTYAEIYDDASNRAQAQQTMVDLIRVAHSKVLTDVNVAIGTSVFYLKSKKYQTALNTIRNYLRVAKKPSIKLMAYYLLVLVEVGELPEARKVFKKLKAIERKTPEVYFAMSKFFEIDEQYGEGKSILRASLEKFPSSVKLLLEFAKYELRDGQKKFYASILKRVKKLRAEESPSYYAQFLEAMGMLSAMQGGNAAAVELFKQALNLKESDELRSKLAALELGGSVGVEKLISESKIIDLMRKAKIEVRKRAWEQAFLYAIEAADLNDSYIPAQLLLANIQVERGYFQSALNTLKKLSAQYPSNANVNLSLIEAYISSYRLNDAQQHITNVSQTPIVKLASYAATLARYYSSAGDSISAMKWFDVSIKRDGLNSNSYYEFAKTLLDYRRYKRSKARLSKAITLDPLNELYHSLYAKILFELEGAEVAIGYLREFLQKSLDSPLILGDIASFYYKNGQLSEFEEYKAKVEKLNRGDSSFYAFLLKSARLNDKPNEVTKYAKELIKLNPGDLPTRIILGENYLAIRQYQKSIEAFKSVQDRLASYPKVNYYLAKVYLQVGNVKKAFEAAQLEVKNNPRLEYGHFILGEVYKSQKKWLKAEKSLETATTINKNYVEALSSICWIHYRQNRLKKALRKCKRARQNDPNNPEIRRKLGYIYKETGQSDLAWEAFDTYLKLNPAAKDRRTIDQLMRRIKN